jgi:hypothetical protein
MTSDQQTLVINLILGRIPYDEFVSKTGLNPVADPGFADVVLREGLALRDGGTVECGLMLAFHFKLITPNVASLLAALLLEPWHHQHEDIARALQELRVPSTAGALARAALVKHQYLAHDDSHALARKCTWALADIGSSEARAHLENLAQDADPEIAGYAQKRLDDWQRELNRKGPAPRSSPP